MRTGGLPHCCAPLTPSSAQREHGGDHAQHGGPGDQPHQRVLLRQLQECGECHQRGAGLGALLGAPLGFWGSRGWGCSALPPQLLKKIKRCERKGSESVTEEKCAVLFSTNVALSPSNVSVHLQVPAPLPWDGAGCAEPSPVGHLCWAGMVPGQPPRLAQGHSLPPGPVSAHRGHRPREPGQQRQSHRAVG